MSKLKRKNIFWGIILIASALLLIFDGVGAGLSFFTGIPALAIIVGVLCVAWAVSELFHRRFYGIFFPLAFAFLVFEGRISELCGRNGESIISNWVVLIAALMLTVGVRIVFGREEHFGNTDFTICSGDKISEGGTHHKKSFSSTTKYLDAATITNESFECNMGSMVIYIQDSNDYNGNGVINLENNMASMVFYLPDNWCVTDNIENNLGSIKIDECFRTGDKHITFNGENNMASLVITGGGSK